MTHFPKLLILTVKLRNLRDRLLVAVADVVYRLDPLRYIRCEKLGAHRGRKGPWEGSGIQRLLPVEPGIAAKYFISSFTRYSDGCLFLDLMTEEEKRRVYIGHSRQIAGNSRCMESTYELRRIKLYVMVNGAKMRGHAFNPWGVAVRLEGMRLKMLVVIGVIHRIGVDVTLPLVLVIMDGKRR
ncbi:hypothetical protein D3C78_1146800 [compost metagenome]